MCKEENLNACECKNIEKYDSYRNGLNKTPGNINSTQRFYEDKVLKELSKPSGKVCLNLLISDVMPKNGKKDDYEIKQIELIKSICKRNGELMIQILAIHLKNDIIIPASLFFTHELVPYRLDQVLREEFK